MMFAFVRVFRATAVVATHDDLFLAHPRGTNASSVPKNVGFGPQAAKVISIQPRC